MNLDAKVCYCFHVTQRKLLNFLRLQQPRVASQLSQCGGAGTGCGWCVPFLNQLFQKAATGQASDLDALSSEEYASRRGEYLKLNRKSETQARDDSEQGEIPGNLAGE